jgi:hypothetical protein
MKRTNRKTLAAYAGLLGRGSHAHEALKAYDDAAACELPVKVFMTNSGFVIDSNGHQLRFV